MEERRQMFSTLAAQHGKSRTPTRGQQRFVKGRTSCSLYLFHSRFETRDWGVAVTTSIGGNTLCPWDREHDLLSRDPTSTAASSQDWASVLTHLLRPMES